MTPDKITKIKLGDACEFIKGQKRKDNDGDFLAYGAGWNPISTTSLSNCEADTIRLTRKGTVGKTYWHKEPFWMEGDSLEVRPKDFLNKRYLYHWLKARQPEISNFATSGTIPNLIIEMVENMDIDIPDLEYQRKAVEILDRQYVHEEWFATAIQKKIKNIENLSEAYLDLIMEIIAEEESK